MERKVHIVIDENMEEQKTKGFTLPRIMHYFTRRWIFFIGVVLTFICGALPAVMNIIMGKLVTGLTEANNDNIVDVVTDFTIQLAIFFLCFSVLMVIKDLLTGYSGPYFLTDIRTALYKKLMSLDISFFDLNNTGGLLNKFTSDCAVLNEVYVTKTYIVLQDCIQSIVGIVIAFIYSWQATLACFIGFILVVVVHFVGKYFIDKLWDPYNASTTDAATKAEQVIAGFRTVKSFDKEMYETDQFKKSLDEIDKLFDICSIVVGIKNGLLLLVCNSMLVGFLYFSCWIIVYRPGWGLVAGDVVVVVNSFIFAVVGIIQSLMLADDFMRAGSSARKVLAVLEEPVFQNQREGDYPEKTLTGKIEFKDVSFKYQTNEQYAVKDLTFTVEAGETVALVGESGCGKSTTLQLLQRFYEIESGEILVDGIDIRTLSPHYLRQQISIVPQSPVLFSMSIRDNIRYAKPDANDAEIDKAAEIGNARNFIMTFPDNYKTMVEPSSLSGGQKQRICLSRAILTNSPILLLDEATAALDTESERLVQQSLETVRKGKTAIIVAHRLATVINSDKIYVFKEGKVVECGTHKELVAKNGYYSDLIKYQLQ